MKNIQNVEDYYDDADEDSRDGNIDYSRIINIDTLGTKLK